MNFNELTAGEKAAITYRDLQRRKTDRRRGSQDASIHIYENVQKIRRANSRRKRGRC